MSEIASTQAGRLEGRRERGVLAFLGIPFAEPPHGGRRLRAPEPQKPWEGVRPAREVSAPAPQSLPQLWLARRALGTAQTPSEDCLYLNLWTPSLSRARRPVLVFLHGGAFAMGTAGARLYRGARLAESGAAVVITVNYRLGAFGSLALRELLPDGESADSNCGLRDQIAGLLWVRENVAAFGGDPENVTIFGESAGAMSVGALLAAPAARGLFRRAILQSGAASHVSTPTESRAVAQAFLERLGRAGESVAALRRANVSEILAAQAGIMTELGSPGVDLPWQPALALDSLPELPIDAIAAGAARGIDLLVGTNRDEWKLFALADRKLAKLDEDGLRARFGRTLREPEAERAYAHYAEIERSRSPRSPRERWCAFRGDAVFHWPSRLLLEAHTPHAPSVYAYEFTWTPPLLASRLGACHGLELPFVFGTLRDLWLRPLLGATASARRLSSRMQQAWLAFARSGSPEHDDLPDWPRWDAATGAAMEFGVRCAVFDGYGIRASRFFGSPPT